MTIPTQQASQTFLGNGVTNTFDFAFVGDSSVYILVQYTDLTGTVNTLSPSQYSVFLNPAETGQIWGIGGTITYPTIGSPIASGTFLTITRVLPLTQVTSISNQGAFSPQVIEAALDTLEMQLQQVSGRTGLFRGVWSTNVLYNFGDYVIDGTNGTNTGNYYMCLLANTSGTWATDLSNGDWILVINVQAINTSTATAVAAAAAAASSAGSASTSATSASSSASSASSSASSASASATSAAASAVTAASFGSTLKGTSTTSNSIGIGAKTFTTQSGLTFVAGGFVVAVDQSSSNNYLHGQVTSYSGTTLVMDVTDVGGSGTISAWNIILSGTQGPSNQINVKTFGAVGNGVTDDTAAFVAAETAAAAANASLYLGTGNFVLSSDFTITVPLIGDSYLTSKITTSRRLIVNSASGGCIRNFYITSTMTSGVGGNSIIYSSTSGSSLDIDGVEVVYPSGTSITNLNKQTVNLNNINTVSIRNSRFFGGNLEILNCSYIKVIDNFLDMQGRGNDGIKLTNVSDYFVVTGNHIHNTFNDGVDTFTSGAYGVVSNNVFDTIGYNGIQCKTVYRFSPYTSGSSDQPTYGTNDHVIISDNIFQNITMANVETGSDAAGIYVLFLDQRFREISNAVNNGSGLIRLTTSAYDSVNDPDSLNFQSGDVMKVLGVRGTTEANSIWTITKINSTTIDLQSSSFTNTYISGGYFTYARAVSGAVNNGSGLIRLTVNNHGLTTGNIVIVESVGGVTAANGTWTVTVISASTIDLQSSTFSGVYTSGGYCSLALTAKNAPNDYIISNNILTDINTAGTTTGPTCGIYVSGIDVTLTNNNITNSNQGLSAASYSGAGIVMGVMRSTLTPTFPTNITISNNISQGVNVGMAFVGATINNLTVTGNSLGINTKTGVRSFYGFELGTGTLITNMVFNNNIVNCTDTSFFNTSAANYISQITMIGNQFLGPVTTSGRFDNFIFNSNLISGIVTMGSTTASLASTKLTYSGNQHINGGSSSTAMAIDGVTSFIIKDNSFTGGRDMIAYRTDSAQGIIKDNIGSSILAKTITNVTDNGSGAIRVTSSSHGWVVNDVITIKGVVGATEANGTWVISAVAANTFDLTSSTFTSAYVSGGTAYRVVHLLNETAPEIATVTISGNFAY